MTKEIKLRAADIAASNEMSAIEVADVAKPNGARFPIPEARKLSDGSFFAEQKIQFRADLFWRSRNLLQKIESGEMYLRKIDKQMSDALLKAVRGMVPADLMALNTERQAIWDDLRLAKAEMVEITNEKRKILEDAGLDWREIRISIDELPSTQQEYACRLHGLREPARSEMMAKMLSTGLLKPYVYSPPPSFGDGPNFARSRT